MNYYPHHIGDFNNATRHLTRVERSLYRDLIELYYDTEQPLPANDFDRLARRVLAVTEEEKSALSFVLDEFFYEDGDLYRNERCDQEIEKYKSNSSAKAKAGKASAEARKKKRAVETKADSSECSTGDEQTLNECATNQEPITNNQEPITKEKNIVDSDESLFAQFWSTFDDKRGKQAAMKVWQRKKLDAKADEIIKGAKLYVRARGPDRRYWKQAQGWLNDGRWEDDAVIASNKASSGGGVHSGFEAIDYSKGINEDGSF